MRLSRKKIADEQIDLQTGEIIGEQEEEVTTWSTRDKDHYYKCELFVKEIEERQLVLTKTDADCQAIISSFKKFGDPGKELWLRLCRITNTTFNPSKMWDSFEGKEAATPTKFFAICRHFEITQVAIKKKQEAIAGANLPEGVNAEDYFQYGFYVQDGGYYSIGKDGPRCVAEFTIRVLYLIKSKSNPKRLVEIKNRQGHTAVIDMPTDVFSSLGTFKKAIEAEGNYVFEGTDVDLTRLKKKLFREEKPSVEINSLGYFKRADFYSFANGIYENGNWIPADDYGIVEFEDKHYFLPFISKIYKDDDEEYISEKKFRYVPATDPIDPGKWMLSIREVYGDNGVVGICFYLSAIFRDILFDIDSNFPMLFCFGQRGSGKTSFMDSFKHLFGQPQDSISLENPSSRVGIMRTLSRFYNTINFLDEYKNSLDKTMIGLLKGIYDGMGRTLGVKTNDNQTRSSKPNSAVICGGQEMPTIDNALFTRFIQLEFVAKNRNVKAYEELKRIEKSELVHITLSMMKYRSNVKEQANKIYLEWKKTFRTTSGCEKMEDRMLHNAALMMVPIHILSKLTKIPFDIVDVGNVVINTLIHQMEKISKSTDASEFWNIFTALVRMGQVRENMDFRFKRGKIYLRLNNVYSMYAIQFRNERGSKAQDKESIRYYLQNSEAYMGLDKQKFETSQMDQAGNRKLTATTCMVFDYEPLGLELFSEEEEADF